MNRSLWWRGILILVIVIGAALVAYPPKDKVNLGLDLRGGVHLVLAVQAEDALRAEADKDMDTLLRQLEQEGVTGASARRTGDSEFEVTGVPPARRDAVKKVVDRFLPFWSWSMTSGGVTFERRSEEDADIREQAVRQAEQTIRNRIDAFGVAEPVIQRQGLGSNRIVVQLPGVDDPERVKELIKNTALLEFRFVTYPSQGAAFTEEEILRNFPGGLPGDVEIFPQEIRGERGESAGTAYLALESRRIITGRDLRTARSGLGQFNEPVVRFYLSQDAGRIFGEATGANVGRRLAIVLDGKVQSAPVVQSRITDEGVIEGQFTQAEVEDLVTVLRSGALPASIAYLEERAVGPSLGQDSIDQGLRASLLGGALVVALMLLVYRLVGINAVLMLTMNLVLVFGALAYFGATLTLPGIAGIVLTMGMAVDANVLIFERIKEELRAGRTVKAAVAAGFGKALSAVIDTNVTTLIAALFLFQFGTGPIRGFAVTLSVGILASLFTAVFTSRWVFDLILSSRRRAERLSI
ncbi:MAG TPA: protein translocase subunit SecD [Thermoanaerobaculia bacterium]|nr:protein translocase subunit SecD [Thermoanaerobaculia bacterium]